MVTNLINDLPETTDLLASRLDSAWVHAPAFVPIPELSKKPAKHRTIKPGGQFNGSSR
jgi:hypothetical protein